MHYSRWSRHGTTDPPPDKRAENLAAGKKIWELKRPRPVIVCGHTQRKHKAKGMCASCYTLHLQKSMPRCGIAFCERAATNGLMCGMHAFRLSRHNTTEEPKSRGNPNIRFFRKPQIARINQCGHSERQHGAKGMCKSCYQRDWQRRHPDAITGPSWLKANPQKAAVHRRRATLKQHGVTLEQYETMWANQNGRCANTKCEFKCDLIMQDYRNGLQIDHCHVSGKIRGLLCPRCNTALGHIKDNVERLRGLVEYIEAQNCKTKPTVV